MRYKQRSKVIVQRLHDMVVSFLFQFDWVYWTGDLPPHNVWNQSRENQVMRVFKWWQALHIQVQLRIFLLASCSLPPMIIMTVIHPRHNGGLDEEAPAQQVGLPITG